MVASKPPVKNELKRLNDGVTFKMKLDRYSIPYDKNTFKTTMKTTDLMISHLKTFEISDFTEKSSSLSLKKKKKMMKI